MRASCSPKPGRLWGAFGWWSQSGSNRRPPACKAGALPAELWPHGHPTAAQLLDPVLRLRLAARSARRVAPSPGIPGRAASGVASNPRLVGLGGFEPPTSPLSGVRSNQLSYRPRRVAPDNVRLMASDLCGCSATRIEARLKGCLLYTSPSPRDLSTSRMPSSA